MPMEVSTQDRARFRGTRQLVGNLVVTVAGLSLFVVLGISIILAPPSTGSSGKWGGVAVSVVRVLAMGALLFRMRTAFTVELAPETLMYRTLLRNVEFNRSEVVGIGLKDRDRGMAKISQPIPGYARRPEGLAGRHGSGGSSSPRPAPCRRIWLERLTTGFSSRGISPGHLPQIARRVTPCGTLGDSPSRSGASNRRVNIGVGQGLRNPASALRPLHRTAIIGE